MPNKDFYEIVVAWSLMTPMEQSLWGTTLALRSDNMEEGMRAADRAVTKLREVGGARSLQPEPEYEAARANCYMDFSDFAVWYPIAYQIRHAGRDYKIPSKAETSEAFERYALSLNDYH